MFCISETSDFYFDLGTILGDRPRKTFETRLENGGGVAISLYVSCYSFVSSVSVNRLLLELLPVLYLSSYISYIFASINYSSTLSRAALILFLYSLRTNAKYEEAIDVRIHTQKA